MAPVSPPREVTILSLSARLRDKFSGIFLRIRDQSFRLLAYMHGAEFRVGADCRYDEANAYVAPSRRTKDEAFRNPLGVNRCHCGVLRASGTTGASVASEDISA